MPAARTHRDPVVLDDIPNPVAVRRDGPEAEEPERGVPAVARGEDGGPEEGVARIGEDVGEALRAGGRARGLVGVWRGIERLAAELALEEAVEGVEVAILAEALGAFLGEGDVTLACLAQRVDLLGRACV